MFNKINEAHLLREIADLKSQIEELQNEQIKQRRDNSDLMYNLDSDNVPSLNGIVKEIRLIVQDGAVNGALIIQAINAAESEAQIVASHINLSGMTIQLNAGEGITIDSPNFKVTSEGNMTCQNAEIKRSCALGTDIGNVDDGEENGMLIGPIQETDTYIAATRLSVTKADDGPGTRLRSIYKEKPDGNIYTTDLVMTGKGIKMLTESKRPKKSGNGYTVERGGMGVNLYVSGKDALGHDIVLPRAYMIDCGGNAIWTIPTSQIQYYSWGRGMEEVSSLDEVPEDIQKEIYYWDDETAEQEASE